SRTSRRRRRLAARAGGSAEACARLSGQPTHRKRIGMSSTAFEQHGDELAIIGIAGRFPGARTLDAFWQNLCDAVESIASFSDQELLAAGADPAQVRDPNYIRSRGVLDDIEWFDASF